MNIVITGASAGIGFQLVKIFAKENHAIVAIARNREQLELLRAQCLAINPLSKVYLIDYDLVLIENSNNGIELQTKILEVLPHIDILINNAALLTNRPFTELTIDDFLETYKINIFSVVALIQLLLPHMGKKSLAHIVNISSMGAIEGSSKFPGLSAYSSSKSALNCLSECLAVEFNNLNIRVNCLALGAVQTDMLSKAFPNYKAPLTAEEMAKYIAQFSLTGQHYFNGKIIPVSSSIP